MQMKSRPARIALCSGFAMVTCIVFFLPIWPRDKASVRHTLHPIWQWR